MVELSAVFMAVTFAIFALYGVCAAALRARVLSRPQGDDTAAALVRRPRSCCSPGRLAITER
jgi:hypothetical protein